MFNVISLREFSTPTFLNPWEQLRFSALPKVGKSQKLMNHRDDFIQETTNGLKGPLKKLQQQLRSILDAQTSGNLTPRELSHQLAKAETLCSKLNELAELAIAGTGNELSIELRESNLSDITADVLERYMDLALENGSILSFFCPTAVIGEWDKLRLDQLVSNLVLNAVTHAPGSNIEVRITCTELYALLEVKDSGPGIPLVKQAGVFERFTKANEASEGFGNGLWFAKKIVERFQGNLQLVSRPGEGSTFIVELPLRQMLH